LAGITNSFFGNHLQVAVTVHVLWLGAWALYSLVCIVQSLSLGANFIFQAEPAEATRWFHACPSWNLPLMRLLPP
jgi:hypothetical protein